ncbi:MAG: AsmA-like C-terminal region-containing protein [Pseudomonadota bacterium]
MNATLMSIGIAIIIACIAAIAAPFVIDWSTQRSFFENQASRIMGQPVTIAGLIDARILPEPEFTFEDMTIGDAEGSAAGALSVASARIRISPGSLLKGLVEITGAAIEAPAFGVVVTETGELILPAFFSRSGFDPGRVSADTVDIQRGAIMLEDRRTATTLVVEDISGAAVMRALDGPYRFDGGAVLEAERYGLQLVTGRAEEGALPFRLSLLPASVPASIDIDGIASLRDDSLEVSGNVTVAQGLAEDAGTDNAAPATFGTAWTLTSAFDATTQSLQLDTLELALGGAEREVRFAGSGAVPFDAAAPITLALAGRQVDLDRFAGAGPSEPITAINGVGLLLDAAAALASFEPLGRAVEVDLDVGVAVVGGEIIQDTVVEAAFTGDRVRLASAAATLPGDARLSLSGDVLALKANPRFEGRVSLDAANLAAALEWVTAGRLERGPETAELTSGFRFDGDVFLDRTGVDATRFDGGLGGAPYSGRFTYTGPSDQLEGQFSLELDAEALALPALPGTLLPGAGASDNDTSAATPVWDLLTGHAVDLDVAVASLEVGDQSVRDLSLDLSFANGIFDIRDVKVRDLFATTLEAEGRITGWPGSPDGAIKGSVRADDLRRARPLLDLLGLTADAIPDDQLVLLEPATLDATLTAGLSDAGAQLSVVGTGGLGETALTIDADLETTGVLHDDRFVSADIGITHPRSRSLLAQLGIRPLGRTADLDRAVRPVGSGSSAVREATALLADGPAVPDDARADMSLLLNGVPSEGLEVVGQGDVLGLTVSFGGVGRQTEAGSLDFDIAADVETDDLTALSAFLDLGGTPATGAPVEATARFLPTPGGARIENLEVSSGDARVIGSMTVTRVPDGIRADDDPDAPVARVNATLRTDRLALADALGLFIAPEEPEIARQSPLFQTGLGGLEVGATINAGAIGLPGGAEISRALLVLSGAPGTLRIDTLTGRFIDGDLDLTAELAPGPAGVLASGQITLDDADFAAVARLSGLNAVDGGGMTLAGQMETQGATLNALLSGLTGDGRYAVKDIALPRLNPNAFSLILRAADAGLDMDEDEIASVFSGHLASGPLEIADADGAFAVVGGEARLSNTVLIAERADVRLSAALDLAEREVSATMTLEPQGVDPALDGVTSVTVRQLGRVGEAVRSIDVAALAGFLNVRMFEREVERVETLQADILERQRLTRELAIYRAEIEALEAAPIAVPDDGADATPESQPERQPDETIANPVPDLVPAPAPAEPALAPPLPLAPGPETTGSTFTDRLRAVLDEADDGLGTGNIDTDGLDTGGLGSGAFEPGATLPPLPPPRSIQPR